MGAHRRVTQKKPGPLGGWRPAGETEEEIGGDRNVMAVLGGGQQGAGGGWGVPGMPAVRQRSVEEVTWRTRGRLGHGPQDATSESWDLCMSPHMAQGTSHGSRDFTQMGLRALRWDNILSYPGSPPCERDRGRSDPQRSPCDHGGTVSNGVPGPVTQHLQKLGSLGASGRNRPCPHLR